MSTVTLTKDNFADTVASSEILLIDFWAEWCAPCRTFAPVFQKASEKYENITFGKVDTEAERELSMAFEIRAIPTLMCFREQILIFNQAGALPPAVFQRLIDQILALDMDEVRRQIAEQEGAAMDEDGDESGGDDAEDGVDVS